MSSQLENWTSNPDETHGPLMSTATWLLCGISGLFLALRLYIRYGKRRLWTDDLLLVVAWAFLLLEVITIQLSVNLGYGKHALDIDPANLDRITYYGAAGLTLSIIAINVSKISFAVTLLGLTDGWLSRYCWFAIATLSVFAIPITILPWVQCRPLVKTFIDFWPGECTDKRHSVRYGEFQAVWAAAMDISLAVIPWRILWHVQMRLAEKIGVSIAMSLGVLAGATAIIRSIYVKQLASQDISYDAKNVVIWSATESAVTIVAISIPVLRAFIKRKVDWAIDYYRSSSNNTNNDTNARHTNATNAATMNSIRMSRRLSTQEPPRKGSMTDPLAKSQSTWLSLDDSTEDVHGLVSDNQGRQYMHGKQRSRIDIERPHQAY